MYMTQINLILMRTGIVRVHIKLCFSHLSEHHAWEQNSDEKGQVKTSESCVNKKLPYTQLDKKQRKAEGPYVYLMVLNLVPGDLLFCTVSIPPLSNIHSIKQITGRHVSAG